MPLKLKTQSMEVKDGKLVDATGKVSSPSAEPELTRWFTEKFGALAAEAWSVTPKESGRVVNVPIFAELHRVAVLVAAAEKLKVDGVRLPDWMATHPGGAVPLPDHHAGPHRRRGKADAA